MQRMKKRNESAIVTAILKYLQSHENLGNIKWCDRLNSGTIYFHGRMFRGCRKGTPDLYFIATDGTMVWVEVKTDTGKLEKEQEEFLANIKDLSNHNWLLARSVDDIQEFMKTQLDLE